MGSVECQKLQDSNFLCGSSNSMNLSILLRATVLHEKKKCCHNWSHARPSHHHRSVFSSSALRIPLVLLFRTPHMEGLMLVALVSVVSLAGSLQCHSMVVCCLHSLLGALPLEHEFCPASCSAPSQFCRRCHGVSPARTRTRRPQPTWITFQFNGYIQTPPTTHMFNTRIHERISHSQPHLPITPSHVTQSGETAPRSKLRLPHSWTLLCLQARKMPGWPISLVDLLDTAQRPLVRVEVGSPTPALHAQDVHPPHKSTWSRTRIVSATFPRLSGLRLCGSTPTRPWGDP